MIEFFQIHKKFGDSRSQDCTWRCRLQARSAPGAPPLLLRPPPLPLRLFSFLFSFLYLKNCPFIRPKPSFFGGLFSQLFSDSPSAPCESFGVSCACVYLASSLSLIVSTLIWPLHGSLSFVSFMYFAMSWCTSFTRPSSHRGPLCTVACAHARLGLELAWTFGILASCLSCMPCAARVPCWLRL